MSAAVLLVVRGGIVWRRCASFVSAKVATSLSQKVPADISLAVWCLARII